MKKLELKIKCENCGKPPTINVQKVWIKWNYNHETGNYSANYEILDDINSAIGDENLHLCKRCFLKWRNDEQ